MGLYFIVFRSGTSTGINEDSDETITTESAPTNGTANAQ